MINLHVRWSFSTKLSFWIVIMAIPVFLASVGLHFHEAYKMIHAESVDRAHGVLNTAMHHIRRYLISAETVTHADGWLVAGSMHPDSLMAFSRRIVQLNPYTDACAISTEPGILRDYPERYLCYTIREGDSIRSKVSTTYNYFNKNWYKKPRERQRSEWIVYYDETNPLNLDKKGMLATYSQPLYGPDHQFVGVVSTGLSLMHISQVLAEEKPYPHSYFILIDDKGHFVGHPDSTLLFSESIFSVADPRKEADLIALGYEMTKGSLGQMSVVIDDVPSLVCFRPVPGTTWSLGIVCPESDITKDYDRFFNMVIALLIVGMLIIVICCHRTVAQSFKPLRTLLNKTQQIARGDMEVSVERSTRTDNIGQLQNSYATMLEALRHYMDDVRAASNQARQYNKELEQATQLVIDADKQKTTFVQNMTHQVRTPLNIIMGYAQILNMPTVGLTDDGGMSEEDLRTITNQMDHNAKLLRRMVLMLFDCSDSGLSQSEKFQKLDMVSVNQAVQEMMDYVMVLNQDSFIRLETEVADDFCIKTNKKYLQYSLGELMLNAVKYSDGEHIVARIKVIGEYIHFIVEDTGTGIPEGELDRLFEFFTKNDDFSEGLGLGLPLIKRHAKNLGGRFFLDSSYKKGCRFIIELPLE